MDLSKHYGFEKSDLLTRQVSHHEGVSILTFLKVKTIYNKKGRWTIKNWNSNDCLIKQSWNEMDENIVETLSNQYTINDKCNCKAMPWTSSEAVGFLFRKFVFLDLFQIEFVNSIVVALGVVLFRQFVFGIVNFLQQVCLHKCIWMNEMERGGGVFMAHVPMHP